MQRIAEGHGGKCLSKEYMGADAKLTWLCKEDHRWEAAPGNIKHRKSWCPACAGMQKGTIEEMQEIAKENGGECLSRKYINARSKIKWQCKEGHQWEAAPYSIKQGCWCRICGTLRSAEKQKSTIEQMQKVAKENGGKCLSEKYIDNKTKLTWRCKNGHQWNAAPSSVQQGSWCSVCSGMQKNTIEEMQEIAKEHGGKCLSKEYINLNSKLEWQCKNGHRWEAIPSNIKHQKSWCRICAGLQKGTIEEMQEIAKERGGKCLSHIYTNNNIKIKWQCKNGHPPWEATPGNIKALKWCPHCRINYGEEIVSLP